MRDLISVQIRDPSWIDLVACSSPASALEKLLVREIDLLIMDSRIADLGLRGFLSRLAQVFQEDSPLRILLITRPDEKLDFDAFPWKDRIQLLTQPFDRESLVTEVRKNLRKISRVGGSGMGGDELVLDPDSYDVHVFGQRVHLTLSEFKLLQELLSKPGETLTRDHLILRVQGEGVAVVDRAIDTHVFSLRKKLGPSGDRIETVRGSGYRLKSSHQELSNKVDPGEPKNQR